MGDDFWRKLLSLEEKCKKWQMSKIVKCADPEWMVEEERLGPNVTPMPHRWLLLGCCLAGAGGWETEELPIFVTF